MICDNTEALMTFSIIISVNGQTELTRSAIRSVLNQKGSTARAEVVVFDDAGSDAVRRVVESFHVPQVIYRASPDRDPSRSVQRSYDATTGDFVLWMGYDDYLMPYIFRVCEEALQKTGAEVVTGLHVYFYDNKYPLAFCRDTVHLVYARKYSTSYRPIALDALKRIALRVPEKKSDPSFFHLHPPATFLSRTLLERVQERTGGIVIPGFQCNHSHQAMVYALARSAVGIPLPLVIIGRLGVSMTQEFYSPARRAWRKKYPFRFSPVSGDTYANHIFEALLAGKARVEAEYADTAFSYAPFLHSYLKDLATADFSFADMRRLWREAEQAVSQYGGTKQAALHALLRTERRLSYALHPFKFCGVWKYVRWYIVPNRSIMTTLWASLRQLWDSHAAYRRRNVYIPLARYGVTDMETLALKLPEIILKETGKTLPR